CHQVVPVGIGPPLAQRQVVFLCSALIAVSGDPDTDGGISLQPLRLTIQGRAGLVVQRALVGGKEDAVPGRLDEVLLAAGQGAARDASGASAAGGAAVEVRPVRPVRAARSFAAACVL